MTDATSQPDSDATESPAPTDEPRARTIAYVSPIFGAELPQAVFRGVDRTARRRGARLLSAGSAESVEHEEELVRELIESGSDGLVLYPTLRAHPGGLDDYLRRLDPDFPIVLVDTAFPAQGRARVIFDNRRAAHQITRHLLGNGRRRIAFFTYAFADSHPGVIARHQGYQEALHEFGPDTEVLLRPLDHSQLYAGLNPLLDELFAGDDPVDAIIGINDVMAMQIIGCLLRRGIAVPETITVAGFDYSREGARFHPAFTTTEPDFALMGEVAADLLLDALDAGQLTPQTYLLPVPLRVRHEEEE